MLSVNAYKCHQKNNVGMNMDIKGYSDEVSNWNNELFI